MKIKVFTKKGNKGKEVELEDKLFKAPVNEDVVTQYLRVYYFNQNQGSVKKKNRAAVRGGGRKPWRQKGTGRARHGSIRSPIWVGGGIAHPPKPHKNLTINKKMKQEALISALSHRNKEGKVLVVEDLNFEKPKTKQAVEVLENLSLEGKVLVCLGERNENTLLALRNLAEVETTPANQLNAYQVLNNDYVVFTRKGLGLFQESKSSLKPRAPKTSKESVEESSGAKSIESLDLSTRAENALKKAGFKSSTELEGMSKEELKDVKGLGEKSAEEILEKV